MGSREVRTEESTDPGTGASLTRTVTTITSTTQVPHTSCPTLCTTAAPTHRLQEIGRGGDEGGIGRGDCSTSGRRRAGRAWVRTSTSSTTAPPPSPDPAASPPSRPPPRPFVMTSGRPCWDYHLSPFPFIPVMGVSSLRCLLLRLTFTISTCWGCSRHWIVTEDIQYFSSPAFMLSRQKCYDFVRSRAKNVYERAISFIGHRIKLLMRPNFQASCYDVQL